MRRTYLLFLFTFVLFTTCGQGNQRDSANSKNKNEVMNYNTLTSEEERVIIHKGTERPFTGEYVDNKVAGIYYCKRCDAQIGRAHV